MRYQTLPGHYVPWIWNFNRALTPTDLVFQATYFSLQQHSWCFHPFLQTQNCMSGVSAHKEQLILITPTEGTSFASTDCIYGAVFVPSLLLSLARDMPIWNSVPFHTTATGSFTVPLDFCRAGPHLDTTYLMKCQEKRNKPWQLRARAAGTARQYQMLL